MLFVQTSCMNESLAKHINSTVYLELKFLHLNPVVFAKKN